MSAKQNPSLQAEIFARQPEEITAILHGKSVGVAGLGGLGSVVAENLARCGVGKLILVDFDIIEPSNLNRQRYRVDQIGRSKADALIENLTRYNPFIELEGHQIRLDVKNCADFFRKCDVVAECFDKPENKAALIMGIKKRMPRTPVVAASGLAGLGPIEDIKIQKRMGNVYTVGDQQTDARHGHGLFASRVGIVASMQSHLIIMLLVNNGRLNIMSSESHYK